MTATDATAETAGIPAPSASHLSFNLIRRARDHRMIAGVAEGAARYFDVDTTIVRIAFVVLAMFGGAGVPLYLAAWLLIPEEGAGQSLAADIVHNIERR